MSLAIIQNGKIRQRPDNDLVLGNIKIQEGEVLSWRSAFSLRPENPPKLPREFHYGKGTGIAQWHVDGFPQVFMAVESTDPKDVEILRQGMFEYLQGETFLQMIIKG